MVVALHHGLVLILGNLRMLRGDQIFGCLSVLGEILFLEVFEDLIESLLAGLLFEGLLGDVVGGLIEFLVHLFAQGLIIHLVVVLALHVLAKFLAQLSL